MKVFVVTENAGYGSGDIVKAVRTDPDAVTAWLEQRCDADACPFRHDQWCAGRELPKHPALAVTDEERAIPYPERYEVYKKAYAAWRVRFCRSAWAYDVEEWDTEE
jgi:hypothetical protein